MRHSRTQVCANGAATPFARPSTLPWSRRGISVQASPPGWRTSTWEGGARDDIRTKKSTTAVHGGIGDVPAPRRNPGECFFRSRDIRGPAHGRSGRAKNGGKERTTRPGPGELPWDPHL